MSRKNAKAKGNRNEHRSMAIFEALGYECIRSAASLSKFDFVAINSAETVCVQVKTRDWPGSVEMEGLQLFKKHPNMRILVHRWRDRQRTPDVREV